MQWLLISGLFPFSPQHTHQPAVHIPLLEGRENTSPPSYRNLSFSGVGSAALCPTLCFPTQANLLSFTPGIGFFCSCSVSPAPKRFSCCLELRFMAQGMDVWKTSSGSMESLSWEHSCSLTIKSCVQWKECRRDLELVFSSCWNLLFEGKTYLNVLWLWKGLRWSGSWRLNPKLSPRLPAQEALGSWRLHWTYLSVHNLAWLSAAATRACPWFSGAWLKPLPEVCHCCVSNCLWRNGRKVGSSEMWEERAFPFC